MLSAPNYCPIIMNTDKTSYCIMLTMLALCRSQCDIGERVPVRQLCAGRSGCQTPLMGLHFTTGRSEMR